MICGTISFRSNGRAKVWSDGAQRAYVKRPTRRPIGNLFHSSDLFHDREQ